VRALEAALIVASREPLPAVVEFLATLPARGGILRGISATAPEVGATAALEPLGGARELERLAARLRGDPQPDLAVQTVRLVNR
jgi:beta-phosphoglucomutase-like phosphatase (HAD superfamily)